MLGSAGRSIDNALNSAARQASDALDSISKELHETVDDLFRKLENAFPPPNRPRYAMAGGPADFIEDIDESFDTVANNLHRMDADTPRATDIDSSDITLKNQTETVSEQSNIERNLHYESGGSNFINETDRAKIDRWTYRPTDELYLKYKEIYDNPLYYDQTTGAIHWPVDDGFLAGTKVEAVVPQGTIFKRYGENSGEFLGNATDSFSSRALAPHSESATVHYYQLIEDYEMTTGKVAPWFGSDGGAEQFVVYKPDGNKYTISELEDAGILIDITELVEKVCK